MVSVSFFTTLRLLLNIKEIQLEVNHEQSILELLHQAESIIIQKTSQRFIWKLLDDQGAIKQGTIILINGKNILDTIGLECRVKDGDVIALFPPGGGG